MESSPRIELDRPPGESSALDEATQILHLPWEDLEGFASAVSELLKSVIGARMVSLGCTDTRTGRRRLIFSDPLAELDPKTVGSFQQEIERRSASFQNSGEDTSATRCVTSISGKDQNPYPSSPHTVALNSGLGVIIPLWGSNTLVDLLIEPKDEVFDNQQQDFLTRLIPHLEIACRRAYSRDKIGIVQSVKDRFRKSRLTPRQTEIVLWVLQGKTKPEIAVILGISVHSVRNLLAKAYAKLGIESRTALFLQFFCPPLDDMN